jgi:hypothetical protein
MIVPHVRVTIEVLPSLHSIKPAYLKLLTRGSGRPLGAALMRNMGEFIPSVNPQKGSQAHYYGFMNWLFLQPHPRSAIMDSAYQSITVSLIRHVSFCSIHELLTTVNTQNRVNKVSITLRTIDDLNFPRSEFRH